MVRKNTYKEGLVGVQAMYLLDGQDPDRNFFSHPFNNILLPAQEIPTRVLQAVFKISVKTVGPKPEDGLSACFRCTPFAR